MGASQHRQGGFTYLGLLVAVVVLGLMLTVVARVWSVSDQRERETQLLWVGHAYRLAIASYFTHGHQYPATLQQLLLDDRTPVPMHHLRSLYVDPITGSSEWTLIMTPSGTGIMGVASTSKRAPIKRRGFDVNDQFADADCYCSWQFVYYANRYLRTWGAPVTSDTGTPTPGTGTPTPGTATPNGSMTPSSPLSPLKSSPLSSSPFSLSGSSPPPEPPTTP